MRILFINKYDTHGGAAIAAWRLQTALHENYHTINRLLCGIKQSADDTVFATRKAGWENFIERGVNFGFNQLGLQYFWFPFSTRRIVQFSRTFQPDVISVHNLHGGFFKTPLIHTLSRQAPVVWTLHDMWAFTANSAYTEGDMSYQQMRSGPKERKQFPTIGINTGRYLLQRKKEIYTDSRLTVVCPSLWMQRMARQSPVFEGKSILHIPNGIDLKRYHPAADKQSCRQALGIANDRQVLLVFAEKISDRRKGGPDLVTILRKLDQPLYQNLTLLTIGKGRLPVTFTHIQCKPLGYLTDEQSLIQALQAADLFAFPTHEDNLPNTLLEAIACGLPCVTYDVGGCGEIIRDGQNGRLIPLGDVDQFTRSLQDELAQPDRLHAMSEQARRFAQQHFDLNQMAARYFHLFQDLQGLKQQP